MGVGADCPEAPRGLTPDDCDGAVGVCGVAFCPALLPAKGFLKRSAKGEGRGAGRTGAAFVGRAGVVAAGAVFTGRTGAVTGAVHAEGVPPTGAENGVVQGG